MRHIFSEDGQKRLESLFVKPCVFAFDFDGTLAPIVKQPEDARPGRRVLKSLQTLSRTAPVIIVSGRSVSDIVHKTGFSPHQIIGNHGLERPTLDPCEAERLRLICSQWKLQWDNLCASYPGPLPLRLEDKNLSLAIHFREARPWSHWQREAHHMANHLSPPPTVIPGKAVLNLLPSESVDKGSALQEYLNNHKYEAALYVGDDDTDERVFSMNDPRILGIRVGSTRTSAAQFCLQRQGQILRLLDTLIELQKNKGSGP